MLWAGLFYRPRSPTLYTVCRQLAMVLRTRWLTEVGWQMMAQAFKWPGHVGGSAPWVGQTDDGIYDITIARHQMNFPVPTHSAIHITCLVYISQSVNQAKKISIATYVASESAASHCAQRPPTTNVSHAMTACCQFDHQLIIGYGNSKTGYEISSSFTSVIISCKYFLQNLCSFLSYLLL